MGTATPRVGDKDTAISLKIGGGGGGWGSGNNDDDSQHGTAASNGLWRNVAG